MKQIQKMPLKVFVEEYTAILQTRSPDELKKILMGMADEVKPSAREEFIKKLSRAHAPQPQIMPIDLVLTRQGQLLFQNTLYDMNKKSRSQIH